MTHYTRADVDMADRHIAEGKRHIDQQEKLLRTLQLQARPTEDAEQLLATFNSTMVGHREHRAAIIAALEAHGL